MANTTQLIGFYRWHEVRKMLPICRATWMAGVRSGRYPRPKKLSANTVGWLKADIHLLLDYIKQNGVPPINFNWDEYKASL